jgi:hypothetical protein
MKAGWRRSHQIAVRHPDLLVVRDAAQQPRIVVQKIEDRETEFSLVALAHRPSEQLRDQLLAVANPQNRNTGCENGTFNGRTGIVVNAVRATRYDDAARATQLLQRCVARKYVGRYAEFAYLPCDEMAVLTAGIEYRDLCVSGRQSESYFRILSTMIFLALSISA